MTLTVLASTEAEITAIRANTPLLNAFRRACNLNIDVPIGKVIDEIRTKIFLRLDNSKISSFKGMPDLQNLESLDLVNNKISSFKDMPVLQKLKMICLNNSKISSFKSMPNLQNLEILELTYNRISSFKGMPNLPNLKFLNLPYNKISSFEDLPNLPNLPNLEFLNISFNKISNFEGMPEMQNLKELDLEGNKLSSFEGMPELPELKLLNISYNGISSFKGMPELPELKLLNISYNGISSFEGMPGLQNLQDLLFRYTPFSRKNPNVFTINDVRSFYEQVLPVGESAGVLKRKKLKKINKLLTNINKTDSTVGIIKRLRRPSLRYYNYDFRETALNEQSEIIKSEKKFGTLFQKSWDKRSFVKARYNCLVAVYANHRISQIEKFYSDSPESCFLNLNLVLRDHNTEWFIDPYSGIIDDSMWDRNWEISEESIKGQLRAMIDQLFTDNLELKHNIVGPQQTNTSVPPFFDRLIGTAEGIFNQEGIKQRMSGIVNHLISYYGQGDAEKKHCKDLLVLMSEGNASCTDRLTLALSRIENDIAFFRSTTEAERLSVAINAYKLKKIDNILTTWSFTHHTSGEELEDVLYHTLLLKNALGIKTRITEMTYSRFSQGKKTFPRALDQIAIYLNVKDLLLFLQSWPPLQSYYSSQCDRTKENYENFAESWDYTADGAATALNDFFKECALEGLIAAGYVVNNPFYEISDELHLPVQEDGHQGI